MYSCLLGSLGTYSKRRRCRCHWGEVFARQTQPRNLKPLWRWPCRVSGRVSWFSLPICARKTYSPRITLFRVLMHNTEKEDKGEDSEKNPTCSQSFSRVSAVARCYWYFCRCCFSCCDGLFSLDGVVIIAEILSFEAAVRNSHRSISFALCFLLIGASTLRLQQPTV